MRAIIFPGQGAQYKGMGQGLFEKFPNVVKSADQILGYSVKELCITDTQHRLSLTQYTQPALYTVSALSYLAAKEEGKPSPMYLAGHSLGEYNALFAAGAFDFETGLRLVQKRGELMSRAVRGAMAAVLGMSPTTVLEICRKNGLSQVYVANINSPSQVVISGEEKQIAQSQPILEAQAGVRYVRLNVSGAFHCPLMQQAAQEFQAFCQTLLLRDPNVSVISNVTARPYTSGSIVELLVQQITSPVQWSDSVRFLLAKGVQDFVEMGPGQVLTKLVSQIRQDARPLRLDDNTTQVDLSTKTVPSASSIQVTSAMKTSIVDKEESPAAVASKKIAPPTATSLPAYGGLMPAQASRPDAVKHPVVNPVRPAVIDSRPPPSQAHATHIRPEELGSASFKKEYKLKYAYYAGSMYKGISSRELVVRMGKAGFMGFFGTGGMAMSDIENDIRYIQSELADRYSYGCNLLHSLGMPELEEETVDILLRNNVNVVEASAFMQITPALVRYKLKGLSRAADGSVMRQNRIIAKVSHVEVARAFLTPAPERIVQTLLLKGLITAEQAELAARLPVADDLCVESDSGGHTDQGVAYALFPAIAGLRDEILAQRLYAQDVRVGAAGGIGTGQAALAAFMLGADFIVTGSINQCSVEARTSDVVKDMLQDISVNDTDYAPAGDMFEIGAKVQVVKKGVFFPARANKLYDLYRRYNSLEEIDAATRKQIEDKYFKRSFTEVWDETKAYYLHKNLEEVTRAEQNGKHKMALIFRWYFVRSTRLALSGDVSNKVDFQIQCGPAMGAFNQWVKGTALENWRNRHVDLIALAILEEAGKLIGKALRRYVVTETVPEQSVVLA